MKPYKTRKWQHPEGYKFLAAWSNAVLLRFLIRKLTQGLPRSEHRLKTQLDDAGRSVIANIEEGYKRPTTREYLNFLGYSQASLEEIKGDIKRAHQDGFLKSKPGSSLADLGINLKEFKGLLEKSKGNTPLENLYPPLKSIKGSDLTLEIFMELINKTDYLLRQLVASLEKNTRKQDTLSPYQQWLGQKIDQKQTQQKNFSQEILEKQGLIFTRQGVMKKEEAEKRGLEEIKVP